ncbi:MAG: hypothetical protein KIG53_05195 [Oscillospiraceae bacterium]|nr:hypothetical protein [Oscillospiraceae bacterium]
MRKRILKILSMAMVIAMLMSVTSVAANAAVKSYAITNPYAAVTELLGDMDYHYKTNLHTHSTFSDADLDMVTMINGFYDQDFDILAFSDHGVIGRRWDTQPTLIPLYQYQLLMGNTQTTLTTEEYNAVLNGTYVTSENARTNTRGMQCVTNAIEGNMLTLAKNHVNGYFTEAGEGYWGDENDYETFVKMVHEDGGVTHINHPGDWLHSADNPDAARDPENVEYFADILRKYDSCLGIEALNAYDRPTRSDRILWDELLMSVIPDGERNVFGFSNSDAHNLKDIDTSFMDFILPVYTESNLRNAMETGAFFSISRYAKNELGEDFVGSGAYPQVTEITVDDEKDTITVTGINCNAIEWVADGEVIDSATRESDGTITTTLSLTEHSKEISCYVRFQLKGNGGLCLSQAFICDDGTIGSNPKEFTEPTDLARIFNFIISLFKNNKIAVLIDKLTR